MALMPGQPGWRIQQQIRAPRRRRRRIVHASRQAALALTVQVIAAVTDMPAREVAEAMPKRYGRPQREDHPLARAATAGRFSLGRPPPVWITTPAELRAFEVASDRARARRWGWHSERSARLAGRDNRSTRRHRGVLPCP